MMEAFIKLNNSILDCGLTPNELKVTVCLYSCVFGNRYYVQIKQSTIAAKCGIKKVETVANIICNLQRKGIIEGVSRPHKANGWLGTYIYKLKAIVQKGFFKLQRNILGKLNGVQLRMYLFVCRAVTKKNDMWNSFNDISRSLQIGRKKVIAVINELVEMGFICKTKVIKKDGSYSDNHYAVSEPSEEKNISDKKESPKQAVTLFGTFQKVLQCNYIPTVISCQADLQDFIYFYAGVVP